MKGRAGRGGDKRETAEKEERGGGSVLLRQSFRKHFPSTLMTRRDSDGREERVREKSGSGGARGEERRGDGSGL